MIFICNKQHVSNIWSLIHEKVKQHWGWIEKKSDSYKKSVYITKNNTLVPPDLFIIFSPKKHLCCVKSVRNRTYSRPFFSAFELNTDQNKSKYRQFLRSAVLAEFYFFNHSPDD